MAKRRMKKLHAKDALEFFNQVMVEQPLLPFLIPLGLFAWFVERWVVPFSNWVPLVAAVWATIQVVIVLLPPPLCCPQSFYVILFLVA